MTESHHLIVRKMPFTFDEPIDPIWHKEMPEWSHMVNGTSLTMPYLEPFLIRTMREAMGKIDDPALLEDAKGFIGQEGQHYRNHRVYNERLKENGYPELAEIEEQLVKEYERCQGKSLKWRLAYSAGFETMTMGVTQWLITHRRTLFTNADPSVVSLVLWHMVEETEHKSVAFDVYQSLYGNYWMRAWGVYTGSWSVLKFAKRAYVMMLKKDRRWWHLPSRWRLWKLQTAFLWHVGRFLVSSMLPGHNPDKVMDPGWIKHWADAYAGLAEDEIPLLDTAHPDIPARFDTGKSNRRVSA